MDRTRPEVTEALSQLPDPYVIEITGGDNRWQARYPHLQGSLGAKNAAFALRNLHVPQGARIVLVLKSIDYVYTLAFPELGLKEIAVPSLEFRLQIGPTDAGRYALIGDQLCGDPHSQLQGQLVVEPPDKFLGWLKRGIAQTRTPALNGRP